MASDMQPKTLPRGEHDALSLRSFGERERALDGMLVCAATPDVLGLVIAATAALDSPRVWEDNSYLL
jgi:hypothetical protein